MTGHCVPISDPRRPWNVEPVEWVVVALLLALTIYLYARNVRT
jgi:hypothetical protein